MISIIIDCYCSSSINCKKCLLHEQLIKQQVHLGQCIRNLALFLILSADTNTYENYTGSLPSSFHNCTYHVINKPFLIFGTSLIFLYSLNHSYFLSLGFISQPCLQFLIKVNQVQWQDQCCYQQSHEYPVCLKN